MGIIDTYLKSINKADENLLLLLTIILIIYRDIFKLKNGFKYILVTVQRFSYNNMEDNIVKANWYRKRQ